MFLEEILAEKPASFGDIASWAAEAFRIGVAAIVVEPEDNRGGPLGDEIELLIEVGETPGDFPLHLSFFARSPRTEAAERHTLVGQFARHFRTHVLVSDDSLDPCRMVHVSPDGSREPVRLSADTLHRQNAYVIEGPQPRSGDLAPPPS